jgi:hypothetical protein
MVGTTVRLLPLSTDLSLQLLLFGFGVGVVALATRLSIRLELPSGLSVLIGVGIGTLPTSFPYVFSLRYETVVVLLLLALLNAAVDLRGRPSGRALAVFAWTASALTLVRASFHPIWLAVCLVIGWLLARDVTTRKRMLAAGPPLMIVALLVLKNLVLFDSGSLTSWQGMNLLRSIQYAIPQADLDAMAADSTISRVGSTPAFQPYHVYEEFMPPCEPETQGVLSEQYAGPPIPSPFGSAPWSPPNFNYSCYLAVYNQAGHDAITLIREMPSRWFEARAASLRAWFTNYAVADGPIERWRRLSDVAPLTVLEVETNDWSSKFYAELVNVPLSAPILIVTLAFLVLLVISAMRSIRTRRVGPTDFLVLSAAFLYASNFFPGVLFELGEQARFRVVTDAVVCVTVCICVASRWQVRRRHQIVEVDS